MMMKRVDRELLSIKKEALELEDKIADFFRKKEIGQLYTQLVEKSIKYLGQTTRFYLADLTIDIETIIELVNGNYANETVRTFLEKKNNNFDHLCTEWGMKAGHSSSKVHQSHKSLNDAILAIRAALKVKDDNYTRNHMDNVTYISEAIARALGLKEEEIEIVRTEAYFHDIGKIVVPNEILTKPGRLNKKEMERMRLHAEEGAAILRMFMAGDYEEIIFGVENHHKKYIDIKDLGKPALFCSIVTIADAFDAMTTDRPYRRNMGHDYALSELKRFSGIQFDPTMVDLILKTDALNPKNFVVYRTSNLIH